MSDYVNPGTTRFGKMWDELQNWRHNLCNDVDDFLFETKEGLAESFIAGELSTEGYYEIMGLQNPLTSLGGGDFLREIRLLIDKLWVLAQLEAKCISEGAIPRPKVKKS